MQRRISACASCRHQRKKCTDNCLFAPHFPIAKTREFRAVHKLFGVSNLTKLMMGLRDEDRKLAIDSLNWEALCWGRDPVLGPYGEYRRIWDELRLYKSYFNQHRVTQGSGNSPFCPCSYPSYPMNVRAERESAPTFLLPQHHLATGLNHQPSFAAGNGPYNPIDSKSMESTLWEGSS